MESKDLKFCGKCPFLLSGSGGLFVDPRYDKALNDTKRWLEIKDNPEIRVENQCAVSEYYFGKDSKLGDLAYQLLDDGPNPKRKAGCLKLAEHILGQYAKE